MWRVALPFSVFGFILLTAHPSPTAAQSRLKTDKDKIANAMSAAPAEIARNATIKDWPATEGGQFRVLRQGTNGWVCLPTFSQAPGNEPMCLDREWEKFITAFVTKGTPQLTQVGLAYMLNTQSARSNTDPFGEREVLVLVRTQPVDHGALLELGRTRHDEVRWLTRGADEGERCLTMYSAEEGVRFGDHEICGHDPHAPARKAP